MGNDCLKCHDSSACVNCGSQINDSQPLKIAMKIAAASNFFNGPKECWEKFKDESAELICASNDLLRDRKNNFPEELSDVFFQLLRKMDITGITFQDIENVIIQKTKERHPEQWERVINN